MNNNNKGLEKKRVLDNKPNIENTRKEPRKSLPKSKHGSKGAEHWSYKGNVH